MTSPSLHRRSRARVLLVAAAALFALPACGRTAATPADCAAILDRIVGLELSELGFRDPVLAARKGAELRLTLGPELRRCDGVRLREGAMDCVRRASTTEEISHTCLH
jgi:hypothetical protein